MFYDRQFSGKLYMLYIYYHFSSDDIQEDRFVRCPKGTQRKEECIVDTALGHRFVKRFLRGDVIPGAGLITHLSTIYTVFSEKMVAKCQIWFN